MLYSIDRTTGAATPIGMIGFKGVGAMDVHPTTGTLYAVAESASCCGLVLIAIDQTTGVGTEIGETGIGHRGTHWIRDLSFHSDGTLYGQLSGVSPPWGPSHLDSLLTFDTDTGLATLIGLPGIPTGESGLTFNGTNTLFLAASQLYTLSTSTGIATLLGSITFSGGGCSRVKAIDRDPATGVFYAALECGATDGLGTFDINTRTVTFIGSSVADLDGLVVPGTSTAPASGPASALTSTITASADSINADGVATAAVTVQLFDATSTALTVGGDHVALSTTLGTLSAVTDNGNGNYTAVLTAGITLGTATVTGIVNGSNITDDATVQFTVPWESVSTGATHTCGLTVGGTAYCWGWNADGALGNNSTTNSNTPVPVDGGFTFQFLNAGGFRTTCGVTTGGAAYCWGDNSSGQLGNGSNVESHIPVPVAGGLTFQSLSVGTDHSCGVTTTSAAYCWGNGTVLGNGFPSASSNVPVAVGGGLNFQSVDAFWNYTCGVTTTDAAYCWGSNSNGQLGDSSNTWRYVPTAVRGGLSFQSVTTGGVHSCGLTPTGAAYCWGGGTNGELGNGASSSSIVPVEVTGGLSFQSLNAGSQHTCGVTTTGVAYCWGLNPVGQLGNGSIISSNVPLLVAGGLTFQSLNAGEDHTCGVTTAGAAYCWGLNFSGQLGNGSIMSSNVPVRVVDP
ncbi:MAG: hypothetical protein IID06_00940 [Gemmatimonadetes bacterium]|nr:hypothetical protein [Gemmatimonadota bacterium]